MTTPLEASQAREIAYLRREVESLRGEYQGPGSHNEKTCNWKKVHAGYVCQHDVRMSQHPNGYCNQGCCR